jgi:COMPASS component SWD3
LYKIIIYIIYCACRFCIAIFLACDWLKFLTLIFRCISFAAENMSTQEEWSTFKLVDKHVTSISPEATFDAESEEIKEDILRLIVQYLQNEGYTSASATILDETNVKLMEKNQERDAIRKMSKGIKEGDWDLVAKMIHKNSNSRKIKIHSQQGLGFLYAVCKQEYLELIDRQEYQKAFTFLTTHLKPMEKISGKHEFKDLCYLLTCKSINEVDSFRDWEGLLRC